MLVINGADDYFVPQADTLVFEGRPNTEVHLIAGTGHVAMSKAAEVVPMVTAWLRRQLCIATGGAGAALSAAKTPQFAQGNRLVLV